MRCNHTESIDASKTITKRLFILVYIDHWCISLEAKTLGRRFEVYNTDSKKRIEHLKRDIGATYELANSTLFYLNNHRLKIHKI